VERLADGVGCSGRHKKLLRGRKNQYTSAHCSRKAHSKKSEVYFLIKDVPAGGTESRGGRKKPFQGGGDFSSKSMLSELNRT